MFEQLPTILDLALGTRFIFLYDYYILVSYKNKLEGSASMILETLYNSNSLDIRKANIQPIDYHLQVVKVKKEQKPNNPK